MLDFNNAEKQGSFDLIPHNTIVPVIMNLRPGGVSLQEGDGGWLKENKSGDNFMLDCEFIVTEGEFHKRKIWQFMVVEGASEKAINISRKILRAIIEAARNIQPNDMSNEAINARKLSGYGDLNGLCFPVKVGIEKADPKSSYQDKNKILMIITPDMSDYVQVSPPADTSGYVSSGGYTPKSQAQANGYPQAANGYNNTAANNTAVNNANQPKITPNWLKKPQAQPQPQAAA
jgi:hypothetical protein